MKNIVKHKWLKENIDRDNLVILDVRETPGDYKRNHIKGARYVSLGQVATGQLSQHGGRTPLPDLQVFVDHMEGLGIGDDSLVVIYDDGQLSRAGRLWWILKYIGKEDVFVLEGGIGKWMDKGGETTDEIPKFDKSSTLSLKVNEEIRADMEYVRDAIGSDSIAIVDARGYERYTGQVEPLDIKAGHIPGALNLPWTELVNDGQILSTGELEKKFKNLKDYDEVIVYCGSGVTATVDIMLMGEVGIDAKMYPGSFSDWISYDENQVEMGDSRD